MIKVKTTIGNQVIEAEFEAMSQVHKFNSTYGKLPKECDNCKSKNIYVSYKSPQGNDFYMIECGDCGATANFGILKNDKGLFWKREKMEVYQSDNRNAGEGSQVPPDDISNLPF